MLIAKKPALAAAAAVMLNLTGCGGGGSGGTEAPAPSTPVLPADSTTAAASTATPADAATTAAPATAMGSSASTTAASSTDASSPGTPAATPGAPTSTTAATSSSSTSPTASAAMGSQMGAITSAQMVSFTSAQLETLGTAQSAAFTQLSSITTADIHPFDPSTSPLPPFTTPDPVTVNLVGTMVDGYVAGATVYCDKNGNGVGDAGETSAITDARGSYALGNCTYPVVGSGGTDAATGFPFTGVLKAPSLSTFMTPLTTLIAGTGLGNDQLNRLLGLPIDTILSWANPTKNLALLKTTLAVQQVMAQLAATIQAAEGGDLGPVYARVASALASTLKTAPFGTTLVSGSRLNAGLLLAAAKAAAGATAFSSADLSALVADIKGQAEKFLGAISVDAVWALARALQDPSLKLDPHAGTRYFALHDDAVLFGSQPCTLTDLSSTAGVTLTGFNKIGLRLDVTGAPPVGTSGIALTLVKQGSSGRALQLLLDKVQLSLVNGQLTATVPSDARVYLQGKKANGAGVTASASLGTTQKLVRVVDNTLMLDYGGIVKRVLEAAPSPGATSLQSFLGTSGTFQVTLAISNFNLRKTNAGALARSVVAIGDTAGRLSGVGFTGKVTVLAN